ncbi:hypothetical protein TNCT6_40180 [Streptomyces sp. 6-11-2]|nr:hypothetical protein TNCT6_40180 [Streptomyces sp. 6-11-2]
MGVRSAALWANAGTAAPVRARDPARTAAAFRDFIVVFLSSATSVTAGDCVALPNEPRPDRKPRRPEFAAF